MVNGKWCLRACRLDFLSSGRAERNDYSPFTIYHSRLFRRWGRLLSVVCDAGRDWERGRLAVLAGLRALDERGDFGGVALCVGVVGVCALRASVVEQGLAHVVRGAQRVAAVNVSLRQLGER